MIASVSARAAQALMILAIGGLLASAGPAAAQDSDEFYRIARGESGRRPVAAAPSGGG